MVEVRANGYHVGVSLTPALEYRPLAELLTALGQLTLQAARYRELLRLTELEAAAVLAAIDRLDRRTGDGG